jgi:hypothetical protein
MYETQGEGGDPRLRGRTVHADAAATFSNFDYGLKFSLYDLP